SRGPVMARERALSYNREMRWVLLPYLRRWTVIAATLFAGIAPAETLAVQTALSLLPAAALAVCLSVALVVTSCTAVIYFFLGKPDYSRFTARFTAFPAVPAPPAAETAGRARRYRPRRAGDRALRGSRARGRGARFSE